MAKQQTKRIEKASVAGQNHGAVVRAAVINAALTVRDTAANVAAPKARAYGSQAGTGIKAGAAYAYGFLRNLAGK